ncbi:PARP-type domain-containing protein (Fragment) [Durusdinium trenchii]|uniref:PARP-type domain-containing protein n=1 Tax=Durusdinium trenchii TaxID=1381693 RepID=A0ABP0MMK7_9DINO
MMEQVEGIFRPFPQGSTGSFFKKYKAWKPSALFTTGTSVKHIINSIVPDDTTTRLRGPNPGLRTVRWAVQIMCGDALEANSAAFNLERFTAQLITVLKRMKHCGPAASYIRVGCCLHRLLPRILAVQDGGIKEVYNPGSNLCQVVDALLADNRDLQSDSVLNEHDFQLLVTNMLDEDKNYAAQNGARRQLVQRELARPEFHQSSIIIDMLVQRMEPGINFFLKRTGVLYSLQYLSHANPDHQKLKDESKWRFLKVVRGELGVELLSRYMSFLLHGLTEAIAMGLEGSQAQLDLIFQMVISCVSDLYRRLVEEFRSAPFSLLALTDADENNFVKGWQQLRRRYADCEQCVGVEFTAPLLEAYGDFSMPLTEQQQKDISDIKDLLSEICCWSLLSSDSVEILNGQTQWALSRRGHQFVKQGKAAVETSLLARVVKNYYWLADAASEDTMPSKRDGVHPDRTQERLETDADKASRFDKAASRKIRKLSGNGGLKAEKIDMKLSDKEIDNKLDQTLHTPLVKSLTDDLPNAHDSPCPHFICRKNCHYPRMQQLVKDLSWRLEEHKVEPASLLLFTVDSHSMPLILGVSMKKPITHIFVNGALDAEQVALTDASGTIPQFQSSHQLMLELLRRHSPDPSDTLVVSVDVWACSAFIDPGGMLKSSPETLLCDFTISSEKKTKKKPVVVKLPFGLDQRLKDLRAKKRESQPRTKVQKKSKTKATKAGPLLKKSLPTESSSSSANSDSEFAEDPNEEEEQSAPMSKVVAAEEKTVQEVAQEVEDDDTQRAATADSAQATLSTPADFMLHGYLDGEPIGLALVEGAANFSLPQSRQRVYVVMIRKDWASSEQVDRLVRCIEEVLPSSLGKRGHLEDACEYVEQVLGQRSACYPLTSKDRECEGSKPCQGGFFASHVMSHNPKSTELLLLGPYCLFDGGEVLVARCFRQSHLRWR